MTRIDWIITSRVISRVLLTLVIFFGLITLVESLNTPRYEYLTRIGGIGFALLGMVATSAAWLIKGLPLIVLVGAVVGVVDLQSRRDQIRVTFQARRRTRPDPIRSAAH